MWASEQGHLSIVKTLLDAGVDASIRSTDGYSALDCAANEGYGDVIEATVGHGADVNARLDNGSTALHIAAGRDHAGAVDALIEAGAAVDQTKDNGSTHLAAAAYISNFKSMLALLQHGAKLDVRRYIDGNTALHQSCLRRSKGVGAAVDVLLRWGADETALNTIGERPAELLDVDNKYANNSATRDEIEKARLLLSRAPVASPGLVGHAPLARGEGKDR